MRRKIFIIVPSLSPTGPVKGAIALANFLINKREITLISVKNGAGASAVIDKRIKHICLGAISSSTFGKLRAYKNLLAEAGDKNEVASISMCFSADLINIFCRKYALICSSVRGNLIKIYKMDYGMIGLPFAVIHLISLMRFDKVIAMSSHMADQIEYFSRRKSYVVGNFVDEIQLVKYKKNLRTDRPKAKRFVFVGSISVRKQPLLLIKAVKKLHDQGLNIQLDLIGEGPLFADIISEVRKLKLNEIVRIHGQLVNPYLLMSKADVFILPSMSEGTSRASLEALFIGLPCVLRKIDGNSELIESGSNGILFEKDNDLHFAMLDALQLADSQSRLTKLVPEFFRQEHSSNRYLEIIEEA